MQTLSRSASECKVEIDDKSSTVAAAENVRCRAVVDDNFPPYTGTGVEHTLRFGQADAVVTCGVNTAEATHPQGHTAVNTDLRSRGDVKPTLGVIEGDSIAKLTNTPKAAADSEEVHMKSVNNVAANLGSEILASDFRRRERWLSGTSSLSTSGGEESPQPGWFLSSHPSQRPGPTSTPVNGWLDSSSSSSQHAVQMQSGIAEKDRSASLDLHSINRTHSVPDNISSYVNYSDNSNTCMGFGSVYTVEKPAFGHIQDHRHWLSSIASPEGHWNSRVPIPEPFWSSRTGAPFHPQSAGMSSPPLLSPQIVASQTATVQTGGGLDGSYTSSPLNGSIGDTMNCMQMAQNVSPSTPLAAPPSKKRVCIPVTSILLF